MPRRPSLFLCAALLALAAACRDRDSRGGDLVRPPPPKAGRPRLVVLVIIDQLPSWSFDRTLPHLKGGIARMARESVHHARVVLPYSNTFTASGHAAIATGAAPRDTGIVANEWHRGSDPVKSGATDDPASPLFGPRALPGGESSVMLRVDGVADSLERATGGRARTVALGLKDRSAILAIGKKPDVVVWWDSTQAILTSSRLYGTARPRWLEPAAGLVSDPAALVKATWQVGDPAACELLSGRKDDGAGEGGNHGLDSTFPHSLGEVAEPGKAILNTPFGTQILLEAAAAAITSEELGADDVVDLLSISISSHDYAGHGWGQESWECADVLLDIDRRLADLFSQLDREVGADRWIGVMTSDHGALRSPIGEGDRIIAKDEAAAIADRAATRVLGGKGGPWAHAVSANMIHLTPAFRAQPQARRDRAIAAMVEAVAAIPGMGLVERTSTLAAGDCAALGEPERQRACLSIPQDTVEAIYALPEPGSQYVGDHPWGAGHGCGSEEERTVPVLVRVPGAAAARRDQPVSFLRVAPTIAKLLGVPAPPGAREPPLD